MKEGVHKNKQTLELLFHSRNNDSIITQPIEHILLKNRLPKNWLFFNQKYWILVYQNNEFLYTFKEILR